MQKIIKTMLLGTALSLTVISSVQAESLDDALSYAVKNHPSVKAAYAGLGAAKQSVKEQHSAYFPTANTNLSFGRIYADNTTTRGLSVVRGTGYSWFGEGRVAMNQKIYDWSQTGNRVNAAKARFRSADATLDERMQSVEYQTVQAYIQMLRAQKMMDMAENHLAAMKNYQGRIATLVDNGGADDSELSRAKDIVSLAENAAVQGQSDLEIARASYIEAVGRPPEGKLSEPEFSTGVLPDLVEDAIDIAMVNHPQIHAASYEAKAAQYESNAVSKNLLPQLDGEISYTKRDQKDLIGGEYVDARALVSMNWDYAFGGAQKAEQQRAVLQQQEAEYVTDAVKRTIERDVRVAWASLNLTTKQKRNEQDRLKAAQQTLKTYEEQYEGGQKSILELMTTEMQVFNSDLLYTDLMYSELAAAFALKTLLGINDQRYSQNQNGAS